jgi:stress-induced morphogen
MGDANFKPNQITAESVQDKIKSGFSSDADVHVVDRNGDGYHFDVLVMSDDFKGLSRIQQHQKIYELLDAEFKDKLHALTIKTELKTGA